MDCKIKKKQFQIIITNLRLKGKTQEQLSSENIF